MDGDGFILTADAAAGLLRELIPGAVVADVERCAGGQMSGAYEVRFTGPEEPVIVKIYGVDGDAVPAKEEHVYRLLRGHGVTAMPRVLGSGALDRPHLVMTKLTGRSLESLKTLLAPDEFTEVYRQLGELLAAIHRIPLHGFGYLYRAAIHDPQPTNLAFMTRLAAEKLDVFASKGGEADLRDAAAGFIRDREPLLARCATPRLLHNDFHEGNVLVERTAVGPRVTGLIDVENAMAGDPLADLAKTYGYDIAGKPHEDAKLRGFEAGYGGFPADWRGTVALYRLIHAFELWVFFHEIGEHRFLAGVAEEMRALIDEG